MNMNTVHRKGIGTSSILLMFLCIAAALLFIVRSSTEAAAPFQITGYAWSENIGWIHFDHGKSNQVQIDASKNVTGYAWSENIGWIQFGNPDGGADETAGCPSGTCSARVISDNAGGWEITGWARAEAYSDPQAGGWDGWISLNCENVQGTVDCVAPDYAIRISSSGSIVSQLNQAGSFAWGDTVMGWIDFGDTRGSVAISGLCPATPTILCDGNTLEVTTPDLWCGPTPPPVRTDWTATGQICGTSSGTAQCEPIAPPTGTFTVVPQVVRAGNKPTTVRWNITGATSCDVLQGNNVIFTPGPADGVPASSVDAVNNQITFTLRCDTVNVASTTIRVVPSVYES